MKNFNFLLIITFTLTMISCEKERSQSAIIIRDCTGTYLRLNSKDYQVCNIEKTENFEAGEPVLAIYKRIDECKDPDAPSACYMYHENEGWIEILKIKKE